MQQLHQLQQLTSFACQINLIALCSFGTKDALLAVAMRPGMIVKPEKNLDGTEVQDLDTIFVCVATLKWGVLCWPLALIDGSLSLDPAGSLQWQFVVKTTQFVACKPEPKLESDIGIVIHSLDMHFEPLIKACLRSWSTELVFKDLTYLAGIMGVPNPNSFGRLDLVQAIADKFEDSEFTTEVCTNEEAKMKKKRKATDDDGQMPHDEEEMPDEEDEFAGLLIDALDKDEAEEFKDMKKRIINRSVENKKKVGSLEARGFGGTSDNFRSKLKCYHLTLKLSRHLGMFKNALDYQSYLLSIKLV